MLSSFLSFTKHFFIPSLCVGCKKFLYKSNLLCDLCVRLIAPLVSHELKLTQTRSFWVYSVGAYEAPLRQLINAKHYADVTSARFLGELIVEYTPLLELSFDYIIPVPLHWMRRMQRGYNQTELMAQEISKRCNVPVLNLVERARHTDFQFILPKRLRLENVSGAFQITKKLNAHDYVGARFLLVDDLMTTGATLQEIAKLIDRACKPKEIIASVVSRVM